MQDRFMFRTYSVETKQMRYLSNFTSGRDFYYAIFMDNRALGVGTHIVMQCTGLKDKNGKLIYEGDIVRLFNSKNNFEEIRQVVYKDCAFQFNEPNSTIIDKPLYCFAINYLNRYKHIELEVIGNIHENPELLKEVCECQK